jgi:polyvinyl alcohol dehydrogenase (cytochrome)
MKLGFLFFITTLFCATLANPTVSTLNWGNGYDNTRYYPNMGFFNPNKLPRLGTKCVHNAGGSVSSVISYHQGIAYFPDMGQYLTAFEVDTCQVKWQVHLPTAVNFTSGGNGLVAASGAVSVNGPALSPDNDLLVIGDRNRGSLYAFRMSTGALVWQSLVDPHPFAMFTGSQTIFGNSIFAATSSFENGGNDCVFGSYCYFKGKIFRVNLFTGQVIWTFQTVPDNENPWALDQFSGGAGPWASSHSINTQERLIYVGTGNNYRVPDAVNNCTAKAIAEGNFSAIAACDHPENRANSILAIDIDTGALRWARKFPNTTGNRPDTYTIACGFDAVPSFYFPEFCPPFSGPDADFAHSPMRVKVRFNRTNVDALIVAQKSGMAYCFRESDGYVIWIKQIGPGGYAGGVHFGYGTDGERAYFGNVNSGYEPNLQRIGINWTLADGTVTAGGFWTALDVNTGEIVWQRAEPNGYRVYGPLTIFRKVLVGGSFQPDGHNLFFIDSSNGNILHTEFRLGAGFATVTPAGKYLITGVGYNAGYGQSNKVYVYEYSSSTISTYCFPLVATLLLALISF